jgi:hypothetical protein
VNLILISALVFGLAVFGMSIGAIFGRSRLRGSCGGLGGHKATDGQPHRCECMHPDPECEYHR